MSGDGPVHQRAVRPESLAPAVVNDGPRIETISTFTSSRIDYKHYLLKQLRMPCERIFGRIFPMGSVHAMFELALLRYFDTELCPFVSNLFIKCATTITEGNTVNALEIFSLGVNELCMGHVAIEDLILPQSLLCKAASIKCCY